MSDCFLGIFSFSLCLVFLMITAKKNTELTKASLKSLIHFFYCNRFIKYHNVSLNKDNS